jgi:hypothetical protein
MGWMLNWLVTFSALLATDFCWAAYIDKVKDDSKLKASVWSMGLFFTGAIGVIGYTNDRLLLIPAAAGCFAGTYLGMVWNGRAKKAG